jgi:hypothetical protein
LTGSCEERGLLATEGKRKSEGVLASAASVRLSRGERMAKEAQIDYRLCVRFFSRRNAMAAITSGDSRNRGEHRP